eukprot:Amastigsp_a339765_5.p3 type:complete len:189 gc:universal Amastigsp_a339765_5:1506-940(-)
MGPRPARSHRGHRDRPNVQERARQLEHRRGSLAQTICLCTCRNGSRRRVPCCPRHKPHGRVLARVLSRLLRLLRPRELLHRDRAPVPPQAASSRARLASRQDGLRHCRLGPVRCVHGVRLCAVRDPPARSRALRVEAALFLCARGDRCRDSCSPCAADSQDQRRWPRQWLGPQQISHRVDAGRKRFQT